MSFGFFQKAKPRSTFWTMKELPGNTLVTDGCLPFVHHNEKSHPTPYPVPDKSCTNYRNFADIKDIKTRGRRVDWRGSGRCVVVSNFVFHPAIHQARLTSRNDLIRVLPAVVTHLLFYLAVIFNLLVAMVLNQHCQHDNFSAINSPDKVTIRVPTVTNYTPRQLIFRKTVA